MQHTLEEFLRALRAADVKVSPAEAIDAARTVSAVGYADRELFKDALCATLAKSKDEVVRFDESVETFFARDQFQPARHRRRRRRRSPTASEASVSGRCRPRASPSRRRPAQQQQAASPGEDPRGFVGRRDLVAAFFNCRRLTAAKAGTARGRRAARPRRALRNRRWPRCCCKVMPPPSLKPWRPPPAAPASPRSDSPPSAAA